MIRGGLGTGRAGIRVLLFAASVMAAVTAYASGGAVQPSASAAKPAPSASAPPAALSAQALAERLKARLSWDPVTASGFLEQGGNVLSFAQDVPLALWNSAERIGIDPPALSPSGLVFTEKSAAVLEERLRAARSAKGGHYSVAAILIDPGHGGKDSGAIGEHTVDGKRLRVVEKDLALSVALDLHKALKKRFPDRRILISRSQDRYPSLEDRVEMANEVRLEDDEAIIYVSIHANASFNKNAKGFEVWYLNPEYRRTLIDSKTAKGVGEDIAPILNAMLEEEFTTESIILARNILSGLHALIGNESPNRGVRAEEWFVVRNARMPSVLVELGFVTNPEEARLLSKPEYLKRLSEGIYNGIVDFVGYFETMKGPSPP